jgi:hypothetical protein
VDEDNIWLTPGSAVKFVEADANRANPQKPRMGLFLAICDSERMKYGIHPLK